MYIIYLYRYNAIYLYIHGILTAFTISITHNIYYIFCVGRYIREVWTKIGDIEMVLDF